MIRLMLAAGVTGVIILWSGPAKAERRSESVRAFCQAAPDLCVFVCTPECPGMSDDYVCESRRGRLVVLESGERSYFEQEFSLCWHRARRSEDPVPDPEHEPVPQWPGSVEDAMCRGCQVRGDRCQESAKQHARICRERKESYYRGECEDSMHRHGAPRARRGKQIKLSTFCRIRLEPAGDLERVIYGEDGYKDRDKEAARCREKAIDECVADYREDHPNEESENNLTIKIGDYFEAGRTETISWGGTIGFETACTQAGDVVLDECVEGQAVCQRKADEKTSCRKRGQR